MAIAAVGGHRAVLTFSGELEAGTLRELEEQLLDPRLRKAREWVLEMGELTHLDLACAYALLRAATEGPEAVALTVRGARRHVQRTLHHAGVDAVAVIEG
ncbi:STAS domain-containing protein [Streptomyces sp.]|uniref:STAS domain-containing protein n=1 Tax=Streptomyces sp. TaxID=1931 RepID=UPI002D7A22CD|nr:STAS domain-containing protein [Streptomyces sp.]